MSANKGDLVRDHRLATVGVLFLICGVLLVSACDGDSASASSATPCFIVENNEWRYCDVNTVTRIEGRSIHRWRQIALRRDRTARKQAATIRRLRRVVRHQPSVVEAINLASVVYGVSSRTLFRKASCESGLSPFAKNRSSTASGLFQFLTSTWATTPYARLSIWSPYANAMAAGWMHRVGRGGEWVCR